MTVAVVALALAVSVLVLRQALLVDVDERVNAALEQEGDEFAVFLAEFVAAEPDADGGDVVAEALEQFLTINVTDDDESLTAIVDGRAILVTSGAPGDLRPFVDRFVEVDVPTTFDVTTEAGPTRVLVQPALDAEGDPLGALAVAWFLTEERAVVDDTVRTAALVALIALVVATILIWILAGRLMRPVRELAATARQISETDLDRRLPVEGPAEMAALIDGFNDMVDRLDGALRVQRQFLDDAGHELRTPITIVRGHLETSGSDPDAFGASRPVVLSELDRMQRIVDDLLTLARSERVDFLDRHPVDLDEFTASALGRAEHLGPHRWKLDSSGLGVVEIDGDRIMQAMLNLAANAARHTPPDGEIGVGSRLEDNVVEFWVRDTGEGIDAADHERIFERFTRPDATRSPGGSAGLGLSIVKVVAEAHGGTVAVDSEIGRGSTFTIRIPLGLPVASVDDQEGAT